MGRKVLVVVNAIAGRGLAAWAVPRFVAALRAEGGEAEVRTTAARGDAALAAREARGVDAVVVAGGDGTVGEVLNGLDGSDLPLALLPLGTANLLARDLAIPFDPEGAARVAARGVPRTIDAGVVAAAGAEERRFVCVVGVGFDAAVVRAVAAGRSGGLGFRGWIGPVLRVGWTYAFPTIRVSIDGAAPVAATVAVACNTRNYGGLFTLVPDARPDDGRLSLCLVDARRRRSVFRYLWGAWRGTLARQSDVRTAACRAVSVESDGPVPVQADGDPCGTTPVRIEVRPGAARVLVAEGA